MPTGGRIPILPVLSGRTRLRGLGAYPPSVLGVGNSLLLDRGASAIQLALEHAGIGTGDEVLVPAFHCPSMVWPIELTGAKPVYFRIHADLTIARDKIEEKISERTKAVLAPHFFGQLQDMAALRALCDARHLVLVEDCAHAFFGSQCGAPIGSLGHYAIASPRKFFPLAEGGLLTSRERDLSSLRPVRQRFGRSIRVAYQMVDSAVSFGRLSALAWLVRLAQLHRTRGRNRNATPPNHDTGADSDGLPVAGSTLASDRLPCRASRLTAITMASFSGESIRRARWRNYNQIVSRLQDAHGVDVLKLNLSPDSAPYMVAVLLRRPESQFPRLKAAGIPVWRWEYSVRGICEITDRYAQSLVQLPCHQALSDDDIYTIESTLAGL